MQRSYSLLSLLLIALFLTGCVARADARTEESKPGNSISVSTAVPEPTRRAEYAISEVQPQVPPANCPITQAPEIPFVAPTPYPSKPPERYANHFWYGTPELWTMLSTNATWNGLPHDRHGYSEKVFWWSQDFHVNTDPSPAFKVTIEQLDVETPSSPIVVTEQATNASADFGTAMLTGVTIPESGCWRITGHYKEAEVSFVIWVAP